MQYRNDYILHDQTLRAGAETILNRLEAERREYAQLVHEMCPGLEEFLHAVEMSGNFIEGKRLLPGLLANGGAVEEAEHLTVSKLVSRVTAWRLRVRSHSVQQVLQHGSTPSLEDAFSDVALSVKVDTEARVIDTEFFGWNDTIGDGRNPVDDPEKFHIKWKLPENSEDLRLDYAGFGTNE